MNIYKLTYLDKHQAILDLERKGILTENGYGKGVHAVVEIGLIMITPPVMDGMTIVTPPVYADGYHYDVMSDEIYQFGMNLVEPKNPKHAFAGHEITEEVQPILPTEEL